MTPADLEVFVSTCVPFGRLATGIMLKLVLEMIVSWPDVNDHIF
jgi:hypothetical protein